MDTRYRRKTEEQVAAMAPAPKGRSMFHCDTNWLLAAGRSLLVAEGQQPITNRQ
jgi:hypothetical protein